MKLSHNILYIVVFLFPIASFASTSDGTIINQYAWGENVGWVNFLTTNGNIHVTDTAITGYAWDKNFGWINFAPTYSGVKNDGAGNLSGSAWSAGGGWINFDNVSINNSGKFEGIASGSVYGQLTFDCDHCNVTTDWRPSTTRATQVRSTGDGGSFVANSTMQGEIRGGSATTSTIEKQTNTIDAKQKTESDQDWFIEHDPIEDLSTTTATTTDIIKKNTEAAIGVIIVIIIFILYVLLRIFILSFRRRSQ
jgi:hypothetical protein